MVNKFSLCVPQTLGTEGQAHEGAATNALTHMGSLLW